MIYPIGISALAAAVALANTRINDPRKAPDIYQGSTLDKKRAAKRKAKNKSQKQSRKQNRRK